MRMMNEAIEGARAFRGFMEKVGADEHCPTWQVTHDRL